MSSSDNQKYQVPLIWSNFHFKNVQGAQERQRKCDYCVDKMIDWGYFQPNFPIYSTDVLFYVIFRVKSSKTKFSAELVYEEETVVFQHPSSLKSKQYIGSWAEHVPKLFRNQNYFMT